MERARARAGFQPGLPAAAFVLAALALCAVAAGWLASPEKVLHASPPPAQGHDTDGDGLPDHLELLLGTSLDHADTDGDGYSDAEEFARGSDPRHALSIPAPKDVTVAVAAFLDPAGLHPFTCVYVAGGDFSGKHLTMGVRVGNQLLTRPVSYFLAGGSPQVFQGAAPEDAVLVLDGLVSPDYVHRFGSLSFFTTVAVESTVVAAGAVNLFSAEGQILELLALESAPQPGAPGSSRLSAQSGVYRPLSPDTSGTSWIVGAICAQSTVTVGAVGPVLIQEVVAAECENGWDSVCAPSCSGTVGSTVRVVDPGALIGG